MGRLLGLILEFLADGKYRGAGHIASHYNWDVPFSEVVIALNHLVEGGKAERHPSRQLYRLAESALTSYREKRK